MVSTGLLGANSADETGLEHDMGIPRLSVVVSLYYVCMGDRRANWAGVEVECKTCTS